MNVSRRVVHVRVFFFVNVNKVSTFTSKLSPLCSLSLVSEFSAPPQLINP